MGLFDFLKGPPQTHVVYGNDGTYHERLAHSPTEARQIIERETQQGTSAAHLKEPSDFDRLNNQRLF